MNTETKVQDGRERPASHRGADHRGKIRDRADWSARADSPSFTARLTRSGTSPSRSSCSTGCARRRSTSASKLQAAFIQEGALLAELSSEPAAIVQARDIGTLRDARRPMDAVHGARVARGQTLEDVLETSARRARRLGSLETRSCACSIPSPRRSTLAHSKGIAHRDMKPAEPVRAGRSARRTTARSRCSTSASRRW